MSNLRWQQAEMPRLRCQAPRASSPVGGGCSGQSRRRESGGHPKLLLQVVSDGTDVLQEDVIVGKAQQLRLQRDGHSSMLAALRQPRGDGGAQGGDAVMPGLRHRQAQLPAQQRPAACLAYVRGRFYLPNLSNSARPAGATLLSSRMPSQVHKRGEHRTSHTSVSTAGGKPEGSRPPA